MKTTLDNLFTYGLMMLYKVVYMPGHNAGYYLHKRKFVWWLLFIPILAYRSLINLFLEILNITNEIYTYKSHWLTLKSTEKEPRKLTFKQKKLITKHLMR